MTGMLQKWALKTCISAASAAFALVTAANGQTLSIAYIANDDLWLRGGTDASARRLTHSGACKSPRFSADGSLIAFQDSDIVSVFSVPKADIVKVKIPQGEWRFIWSPTDNTLAVWNQSGLYLFSQRDSWAGEQIVKGGPRSMVLDAVSNNDGQKLLVAMRNAGSNSGPDLGTIYTIDLQNRRQVSTLLTEPGSGFDLFGWSRDSSTILFWKAPSFSSSMEADGLDLYAMSLPSREVRRLGNARTLVHRDVLHWSPDGGSLLLTLVGSGDGSGLGRETWADRPLAEMNVLSGVMRIVSSPHTSTLFPAWSPSGDDIAFVQAPEGRGSMRERKVWIMRRYGTEKRRLTSDNVYREEHPIWLSNETILFSRIDASYRASLWSVTKDGLSLAQVAELPALPEKAWGYYGYVDWAEYFDAWVPNALCSCRIH
jgi:Tol biopolymer transport system component